MSSSAHVQGDAALVGGLLKLEEEAEEATKQHIQLHQLVSMDMHTGNILFFVCIVHHNSYHAPNRWWRVNPL